MRMKFGKLERAWASKKHHTKKKKAYKRKESRRKEGIKKKSTRIEKSDRVSSRRTLVLLSRTSRWVKAWRSG